ncbi:MAG: hypothetical protein K2L03_03760, partial [Bacteroidales bacterium]|nr:hypothetical protein [Bacteroidales bacterium]
MPGSADSAAGSVMLYLTAFDGLTCSVTDSLELTVQQCNVFTLPPMADTTVCRGAFCFDNALQMPDNMEGITVTYRWEGDMSGELYEGESSTYCLTPDQFDEQYYYLTVTTSNGCTFRDTVELTVKPVPSVDELAGIRYPFGEAAVAMCPGDTAELHIEPSVYRPDMYIYRWSTGDTTETTRYTTMAANDSVTLSVTSRVNGCTADTVIAVTVRSRPTISTAPDTVLCPGQSIVLPQIRLDNQALTMTDYEWQQAGVGVITSGAYSKTTPQPAFTVTPTDDTTYYIARLDGDGICGSAPDTMMVVVDVPKWTISPADTTVCYGAEVEIIIKTLSGGDIRTMTNMPTFLNVA